MPEAEKSAQDDDEQAAWRKDYYRKDRPDLDPQSTASWALEQVGLDDPYRQDAGSYDYRQKKWAESQANGNPDFSWFLPALSDEQTTELGGAIERGLGVFNPAVYQPGWQTMQRPSTDERLLQQLTPDQREAIKQMDPDAADQALLEAAPNWRPKMNPFPASMMGTRERRGDARIGWMPHLLDQWNYSPYSTEDILGFFGPDSPDTIRRDIEAYKGGTSALDRTIGGAFGAPVDKSQPKASALVDATEIGSLGMALGVPGMIKALAKKGGQAVGATGSLLKRIRKGKKAAPGTPPRVPPEGFPNRMPPQGDMPPGLWPRPAAPIADGPLASAGAMGQAAPGWQMGRGGNGSLRDAINTAMRQEAAARAARVPGAALGAGLLGAAGAGAYYGEQERKRGRR